MRSMTGYGYAKRANERAEVMVEVKTVNHRYLDLNFKMPKLFNPAEDKLRKLVSEYLSRGHVDIYVSYNETLSSSKKLSVDEGLCCQYVDTAKKLAETFKIENDFSVKYLLRIPEAVKLTVTDEDNEPLLTLLTDAAEAALCELNKIREYEGEKLKENIVARVAYIEELVEKIRLNSAQIVSDYRTKIRERIEEALGSVELDEARLVNEVAFFADKSDIVEEVIRLESHIARMKTLLDSENPVGRQTDFLIQEFNREINTICSKSVSLLITEIGLQMKNEIEKIREQIQNIE